MNRGPSLTFRSLYDEHRIIWDILRTPHFLVGRTAVRQLIPASSFVARNYLSDQQNCKIRMSNVQIIPWYAFYVTPNNAIAYGPRDPILPIENLQWNFRNYDPVRLRSNWNAASEDGFDLDEINRQQRLLQMQNEQPIINFIGMNQQPRDASILNFNDQASDTVTASSPIVGANEQSALCSMNLDLSVEKNTVENFLEGNVDERLPMDDNYNDRGRSANSRANRTDRRFRPRRGQFQQNWLEYLTRNAPDNPSTFNNLIPSRAVSPIPASPQGSNIAQNRGQASTSFGTFENPNILQDDSLSSDVGNLNVLQT